MKYPITVTCTKYTGKRYRKYLIKKGLYQASENKYRGTVTSRDFGKIRSRGSASSATVRLDNDLGSRNASYRKQFWKHAKPIWGESYLCAYCGRLLKKGTLTVDHLYPVGKAQKSIMAQKMLRLIGLNNINSYKNLVPACVKCNQKKGQKTGLWLLRGIIGRHQHIRLLINIIKALIIGILIVAVVYMLKITVLTGEYSIGEWIWNLK